MKKEEINYQDLYEKNWITVLEGGREDFGDLELAQKFLEKIDILKKEQLILEIGCGVGKLCDYLYKKGFSNIIGTEISSTAIEAGKKKFPYLDLRAMDANFLKFENQKFDACISFDLVEHLPDVKKHLKEVARTLKPSGVYLFQTPNILSNSIRETLVRKSFAWTLYHPSLQFSWTLRKKLVQCGFSKIEFVKIPPLSEYKLKQLPAILRYIFKKIPWSKLPVFLQTNFYVIAYK